ncbi:thiamine pyrophosphate enzyme, TPP binding domain protein [Ancylostoma duodenale]|uniref:2-hydroxyacyl-CoA lyase n=1 Tax=Ancylostoma duodenale TaxID=51022 RepID=A0A0C2DNH7_9BILA|nr:thiamine pyrophosphate enzyme, TPP binding domain protein [Ancylostoma duodenale]
MVQQFLTKSALPWLATPGGKGVCTDSHPRSVAPARSFALRESDCIVLIGARLNWILHFGLPPRFNKDKKIIQIDITPEEFHQNVPTTVPLLGDIGETLSLMITELHDWRYSEKEKWMTDLLANANKNRAVVEKMATDHSTPLNYYAAYTPMITELHDWRYSEKEKWMTDLLTNANKNRAVVEKMATDHSTPLNYYAAYSPIREFLANNDVLVVNEGANTMDIGRTMMPSTLPRRRLDAGTFGTMGVGQGYAIAAALYCRDYSPTTKVLVVQGDSAFGFSGMEIETIARYKLPVVTVVFNNSGIYRGMLPDDMKAVEAECRYDQMCSALGGDGYLVRSVPEIKQALSKAFHKTDGPSLVNIIISTDSERKAQAHPWLTRSKV